MRYDSGGAAVAENAYISCKVRKDLYRMVRAIANIRRQSIADCLSELAEPAVKRELAKALKQVQDGTEED